METTDIKNAGLKVTLPRMKILELLENSDDRHLKAEDIYKMLLDSGEEIALATVYRVLTQFESAGLVTRHHFDGGHAVFEIDDGEHHDRLVDISSGKSSGVLRRSYRAAQFVLIIPFRGISVA
jgi:Fur family ferric uptake transcriptional regulator